MDVNNPSMELPLLCESLERVGFPKANERTLHKYERAIGNIFNHTPDIRVRILRALLQEQKEQARYDALMADDTKPVFAIRCPA